LQGRSIGEEGGISRRERRGRFRAYGPQPSASPAKRHRRPPTLLVALALALLVLTTGCNGETSPTTAPAGRPDAGAERETPPRVLTTEAVPPHDIEAEEGVEHQGTAPGETSVVPVEVKGVVTDVVISIVYDNTATRPDLTADWGFGCVIETGDHTLLFDTGASGSLLLANLATMQVDPVDIDIVVLSHDHHDHTGGMESFLRRNSAVTVFAPRSWVETRTKSIAESGATLHTVEAARSLCEGVLSTGELAGSPPEQALIAVTERGCVLVTGCAHAGIVSMVRAAQAQTGRNVLLVVGGFHMAGHSPAELAGVIQELETLGVERVCPAHCTGERAITAFAAAFGDGYIPAGVGTVIRFP